MSVRQNPPIRIASTIVVHCPLETTFTFVTDPHNDRDCAFGATELEQLTPGPIAAGTRFRQAGVFLGRRIEVCWEVTAYEPYRHLHGRSISGPFCFSGGYNFEAVDSGSRVTKYGEVSLPHVGRAFHLLLARLLFTAVDMAMKRLARLLESDPHLKPAGRQ
jgi:hypothetical protein